MSLALQDYSTKTYEPTVLQHDRARREGNVPRSHEVSSTVVFAVGLIAMGVLGPVLINGMREMTVKCLGSGFSGKEVSLGSMLWIACCDILLPLFGLIVAMFIGAILGGFLQVGPVMSVQTVKPKFEHISLIRGLKKMLSGEMFMHALFALLKLVLIGLTITAVLRTHWSLGSGFGATAVGGLCNAIACSLRQVGICVGIGLGAISIADWVWQRYRWSRNLMMTRRQWLEDIRQMSGNKVRTREFKERMWNITKLAGRRLGEQS